MPTASDYENAAERLRRHSQLLSSAAIELTSRSHHWLTGPVAEHYADSMLDVRRHLLDTARVLEHLASTAERRSVICAGFTAAVQQYERLDPWVRLVTPRPQRPAVWAEATR
jgi:hypothetical protein